MLNELYEISQSLEHHGLLESTTHPDINRVGKKAGLLFRIDSGGNIKELKYLTKDDAGLLWKHSKGAHNSFPAITMKKPLLADEEAEKVEQKGWEKKGLTEKIHQLLQMDFSNINPQSRNVIKMSSWTAEQLRPVLDSEEPELAALRQLIMVFPGEGEAGTFAGKLAEFLKEQIAVCTDVLLLDTMKELLIGKQGEKKDGREEKKKPSLAFVTYYDVYEAENFSELVVSGKTWKVLTSLLNDCERQQEGEKIISPLSGKSVVGVERKYPNPNLPVLGSSYLYSKKEDIGCLYRYGLNGVGAFRIGREEANAMNDTLAFLTRNGRLDKTWKPMGDCNQNKTNLLLAYLPEDPTNDTLLAELLGGITRRRERADQIRLEKQYEVLCGQVLGTMRSVLEKNPQSVVQMIMLETLDKGRRGVAFESSLSARRLCDNMRAWKEASENAPPIELRFWEKKKVAVYRPVCPFPADICQLMKIEYSTQGMVRMTENSVVSYHDIYQVYMPAAPDTWNRRETVDHMLATAVRKCRYLVSAIGGTMNAKYALPPGAASKERIWEMARWVSLISILLWMKGIRKEGYMSDTPYNVGQLLKLCDMLHKEYCIQVRNGGREDGSLPGQLIGNELLMVVSENPVEGMNRLRDRLRVYQAWAYTATYDGVRDKIGLIKWILRNLEKVCTSITELPESFSPEQQAQLFLGYLAEIPHAKKENGENTPEMENTDKKENEEEVAGNE